MNVHELRSKLIGYPENMPVFLSEDAEGNGFGSLHELEQGEVEGANEAVLILWPS